MARSLNPVQFGVNPRGLPYSRVLGVAQDAEAAGFDIVTFSDQPPEDMTEAWTLATAVGVLTKKVTLTHGTLNVPYRNPPLVAHMAASLDNITGGGRLVLTLGAGGQELHHTSYGFPFGTPGERFTDLKDAIAIIRGLWANDSFTYQGRRFAVKEAVVKPKPVRGSIPIIIGAGQPRLLRYTGAAADGWIKDGGWPASAEEYRGLLQQVEEGADQAGRDPRTLRRVLNGIAYIGEEDPATKIPHIRLGRTRGFLGTADQILGTVEEYLELGVDTFRLQFPIEGIEAQIARFGEEVIAKARG